MNDVDKLLYSQDAEIAVLGSVLIDPDVISTLEVRGHEFYSQRNRTIWQAVIELYREAVPVDILTVSERLETRGKLAEIGGSGYLMQVIANTPTSVHVHAYAEIVKDKHRRRSLLALANKIATTAYDEKADLNRAAPEFIQALVDNTKVKNSARPLSEYMSELYDEVGERAENPRDIWGISSGFPTLDRITGGFQEGELMILSGEPGVGKSILAMQFAAQMGANAPGAIYSIEMGGRQVVRRLTSGMSGISTTALKTGRLADDDWPAFTNAVEKLSSLPVYMSDGASWTTAGLRADLSRLQAQHGVRWFVLDYLYLLEDGEKGDEIERTALASKGLKRTTKELGMAGIAVHSMNKAGMNGSVPTQGNLRGSGQVIYDADLITFLTQYNPDMETRPLPTAQRENVRMLIFGKGRELEDPRKYIKLVKRPGFPAFSEYATEIP